MTRRIGAVIAAMLLCFLLFLPLAAKLVALLASHNPRLWVLHPFLVTYGTSIAAWFIAGLLTSAFCWLLSRYAWDGEIANVAIFLAFNLRPILHGYGAAPDPYVHIASILAGGAVVGLIVSFWQRRQERHLKAGASAATQKTPQK